MVKNISLAEQLKVATRWPDMRVHGYKVALEADKRATILFNGWAKQMAREAVPIRITDDLLWASVKLSVEADPEWLTRQAVAFAPPFRRMLFMWNAKSKVRIFEALGIPCDAKDDDPDVPEHAGLLFDDTGEPRDYYLTQAVAGYVYDRRSVLFFPLAVNVYRQPQASLSEAITNSSYANWFNEHAADVDGSLVATDWLFTSAVASDHAELRHWVDDKQVIPVVRSVAGLAFRSKIDAKRDRANKLDGMLRIGSGTGGEFRWWCALCAIINRPATVRVVDVEQGPPGDGSRASDGERELRLLLPRERVVNLLAKARAPRGALTEAHRVSGHWCHSSRRGDPNCEHEWPTDQPTRRQNCTKGCGALRWRRDDFKRGPGEVRDRARAMDFSGALSIEEHHGQD